MYHLFVAISQRSPLKKPLEELPAKNKPAIVVYHIVEMS